jgi:hypothetical protein
MLNCKSGDSDLKPITFGYIARSKVTVVVNNKRELVRVPALLHRMSIQTQRGWCRRSCVEFIRPPRHRNASITKARAA